MTLPATRPLCAATKDKPIIRTHNTSAYRRSRTGCLSAAWADLPTITAAAAAKKGALAHRRAVCSWHVDYGSVQDLDQNGAPAVALPENTAFNNEEKVAEHVALIEPSPTPKIRNGTSNHHSKSSNSKDNVAPVPTHVNVALTTVPTVNITAADDPAPPPQQQTSPFAGAMPSLRSLFSKSKSTGGATYEDNNSSAATPLVKNNGELPVVKSTASLASLRKCETVLALTGILRSASSSSSITQPLQPLNRLRVHPENTHSRLCSRCSSLLTLASGSRYSLDSATGGFVRVPEEGELEEELVVPVLCKLCLAEVPAKTVVRLQNCNCSFCSECMKAYVEFEIAEGAYDISCPDAQCPSQGVLQSDEINALAGSKLFEKHKKYRLNREVELDKNRCWCPRAGCETVCNLCPSQPCSPQSVFCSTCSSDFCSNCKLEWHDGMTCKENERRLAKEGKGNVDIGIPFDSDLIKCCPMCNVPIEKDEGCAQMMCKRCKHVFCWYCLASLDDDFLLRHYDKGPCKNKLGHSRASVIWHRTQVIGIFAGFGILLLVASPLLLLAAPCIVCCKCRICNAGNTRLDNEDEVLPTTADDS